MLINICDYLNTPVTNELNPNDYSPQWRKDENLCINSQLSCAWRTGIALLLL